MAARKIKDLNKYLTSTTGLDAQERQQWRDKLKELSEKGDKTEYLRVFDSFSYFRSTYLTPNKNGSAKNN